MSTNRITKGTERSIIENMLDRNREALIETARGLSDADARRRLVASLTTPISLIKHAAAAERIWFQRFWAELDESECDGYSRRDEGTFAVADNESLTDVIAEFERASQRSRVIASRFDLDDTIDIPREGKRQHAMDPARHDPRVRQARRSRRHPPRTDRQPPSARAELVKIRHHQTHGHPNKRAYAEGFVARDRHGGLLIAFGEHLVYCCRRRRSS